MSLKNHFKPIAPNKTKTTIARVNDNPHKDIIKAEAINTL